MNGEILLCSECFQNEGLKLDARQIAVTDKTACPNCSNLNGAKLDCEDIIYLPSRFFVRGSLEWMDYGAAPLIQFNEYQKNSISLPEQIKVDADLISKKAGIGFFYYGPRLWMLGEIYPLQDLQKSKKRKSILQRVIQEYPQMILTPDDTFYRIRKNPSKPDAPRQYDAPPTGGKGRLDTSDFPVLYGSQDLEVCVHECRTTVEDNVYVGTLCPNKELRLLDLTVLLKEECTEFESLDMAIHMLFLAQKHSYKISQAIAKAAKNGGFDGLIYPSYFSLLRTGGTPLDTVMDISVRRIEKFAAHAQQHVIPNIALFGHPVENNSVKVKSINRLILTRAKYDLL